MNKTIVDENGETIGTFNGCTLYNAKGYTYGCIAWFGGRTGYASMIGTDLGMTSGKLIENGDGTYELVD